MQMLCDTGRFCYAAACEDSKHTGLPPPGDYRRLAELPDGLDDLQLFLLR